MERLQPRRPRSQEVGQVVRRPRTGDRSACANLCDAVFGEFVAAGQTHAAERTPWHVYHLPLIAEVYPDARFVHIIATGATSRASIVAQPWGPDTVADAAEEWRSSVPGRGARRAGAGRAAARGSLRGRARRPATAIPRIYAHHGLEGGIDGGARGRGREGQHRPPATSAIGAGKWREAWGAARAVALRRGWRATCWASSATPRARARRPDSRRPRTALRAATGSARPAPARARAPCRAGTARSPRRSRPPPRAVAAPRLDLDPRAGRVMAAVAAHAGRRVSSRRRGRDPCLRLRDRARGGDAARRDRARARRVRPLRGGRVGDAAEGLPRRPAGRRLPRDAREGRRARDPEVGHVVPRQPGARAARRDGR